MSDQQRNNKIQENTNGNPEKLIFSYQLINILNLKNNNKIKSR